MICLKEQQHRNKTRRSSFAATFRQRQEDAVVAKCPLDATLPLLCGALQPAFSRRDCSRSQDLRSDSGRPSLALPPQSAAVRLISHTA